MELKYLDQLRKKTSVVSFKVSIEIIRNEISCMEQLGTRTSLMLAPHCGTLVPLAIMSTWSHQGFKQALKTFLFHLAFAQ